MGRPPSFNKNVVNKKGQWTPHEDIVLVSYIQEHGHGSWKDVPANTGLSRCSKSCRLRWTNYLRPGINRGNFTQEEEEKIIRFQALYGNKWATIARYLPKRTDNDIKNYWNTHLRRKLKKLEGQDDQSTIPRSVQKSQWEIMLQTNANEAKQALLEAVSPVPDQFSGAEYVSSVENIARLLKKWEINSARQVAASKSVVVKPCNWSTLSANTCPFVGSSSSSDGTVMMSQNTFPGGFGSLPSFNYINPSGYYMDDEVNYQQPPPSKVFNDQYNYNMNFGV